MAAPRREEFLRYEIEIADYAKAIAHPARVAILKKLAEKRECICGELVLDLPLAQSTVSQHLKALKEIGLIQGTVDGPKSMYCIDWKNFEKFTRKLDSWSATLISLRQENDCC